MQDLELKEEEFDIKKLFIPLTNIKAIHWIIIIGLVIFCNGLLNNFVGDDQPLITTNPTIQSLQNIPLFFSSSIFYTGEGNQLGGFSYRPLQTTVFSLIYAFFGPSFIAYHFFQLLIYLVNVCLVFIFFKRYFRLSIAFFLCLFFLVHPINSENVLYISAMQEVLFFFFGITALLILQKNKSQASLFIASLLLLFSLFSKETGILFVLFSVLWIIFYKRELVYQWLGYALCVIIIYAVLRVHAIGIFSESSILAPIHDQALPARLINIPEIILFYLKTFIFPYSLGMSYYWVIDKISFNNFFLPLITDILFFFTISIPLIIFYRNHSRIFFKLYLFFEIWFLCGLLFHLQIIPLDLTVSDRWFYFPMVGLLGMIGVISEAYRIKLDTKWYLFFLATILVLLSLRTFIRTFDWRNNMTLASHDVRVSPSFNLELIISSIYFNAGDYKDAEIYAKKSINLYPNELNYSTLGLIFYNSHNYNEAKKAYMTALKYGDSEAIYVSLAAIDVQYGNSSENINFIENKALRKYPHDPSLLYGVAWLEYNYGNKEIAKKDITEAYTYNQSREIALIYNAIMTNKPLKRYPGLK
jgi:tetratricopeptide (TPR) repeat protein